jgi:tetratricopeptide (TPR) repeat protein
LTAVVVLGLLVVWFLVDWRYFNRWTIERNRLEREGRWAELRAYLDAHFATWRPFVRLLGQLPRGAAESMHTVALFQLGDYAAALAMSDRALAKATKPQVRAAVLSLRVLSLGNLGRYDEASALEREIRALPSHRTQPLATLAQLAMNRGLIDEAIAILEPLAAPPGWVDGPTHQARQTLARAHTLAGDYPGALAILEALDPDGPDGYRGIDASFSTELTRRIERNRARARETWHALRLVAVAHVHILADDGRRAIEALAGCARDEWARPAVELIFTRVMANAHALVGNEAESDFHVARMWELSERHPHPANRYFALQVEGTSALHLGRLDVARDRLTEALGCARHPIDRHATMFRLGETHERAGRLGDAAQAYRTVVADGFATELTRRAEISLRRMPTAG